MDVSLTSGTALLVCIPPGQEGECPCLFVSRHRPFYFLVRGVGIGGFGGSLPSAAAPLVCMPVDKKASERGFIYICVSNVQLLWTGWVGELECQRLKPQGRRI